MPPEIPQKKITEQLADLTTVLAAVEEKAIQLEQEVHQDTSADDVDKKNALAIIDHLKNISQEINKLNELAKSVDGLATWRVVIKAPGLKASADIMMNNLLLFLNEQPKISGKYSALAATLYKDNIEQNASTFTNLMDRVPTTLKDAGLPNSIITAVAGKLTDLSTVLKSKASTENLRLLSQEIIQAQNSVIYVTGESVALEAIHVEPIVDDLVIATEIEDRYQLVESDKELLKIIDIEKKLTILEEQKRLLTEKLNATKIDGDKLATQYAQAQAFNMLDATTSIHDIRNSPSFLGCSNAFQKDMEKYEQQPFYVLETSYISACFDVERGRIDQIDDQASEKINTSIDRMESRIKNIDQEINVFKSQVDAILLPTKHLETEKRDALVHLLKNEKNRISRDSLFKSKFVSLARTENKIAKLEEQIEAIQNNTEPNSFETQLVKAQEALEIKRGLTSSKTGTKALNALKNSWEENEQNTFSEKPMYKKTS